MKKISAHLNKYKNKLNNRLWKFLPKGHRNYSKYINYYNFALGKRCFIIGNGPSLVKCDLTLLKNEITIGSNGIFLIFEKMGFKPTFYTVEDGLVAEDRADEINRIKGTITVVVQAVGVSTMKLAKLFGCAATIFLVNTNI